MESKKLHKTLSTRSIFAFGIAGMVASGLFLLPGLIFGKVGSWAHWVYIAAGVLIIPTLFSKAELATAMPRSGGAYYVLDRSLGPAIGTVAGLGTWFSLIFKSSFDLIGLGAYILLFLVFPIKPVAIGLCIGFGLLSLFSTKGVGRMQEIMVAVVLVGVGYFLATGVFNLDHDTVPMQQTMNMTAFLESIGLVYVSFASLIKILSMAEEVNDQEKSIPVGMFAAVFVTMIIYITGMIIIMMWLPANVLEGTLTPVADVAGHWFGETGVILFSIVAFLAFSASANAGLTAASRYPFALSRDSLFPDFFSRLSRFHTPVYSIIATVLLMILFVLVLSPEGVAKLASTFILIIFGLLNVAVIAMRESRILAYDPGFKSPAYPWMQVLGIITSVILIPFLGLMSRLAAGALIGLGLLWYFLYGKERRQNSSALLHLLATWGQPIDVEIDMLLRQTLRERGLKSHDSLDDILYRATILQHEPGTSYDKLILETAGQFSKRLGISEEIISDALRKANEQGNTPCSNHIALPHAYIPGIQHHEVAIIQSPGGMKFNSHADPIYAVFILVGPDDSPRQHLRLLAEIANRADQIDIEGEWREWNISRIKQEFIQSDHVKKLKLRHPRLQDQPVNNLWIHPDCLIALIERDEKMLIPHGSTKVRLNDKLVLIGSASGVNQTVEWLNEPVFEITPKPPRDLQVG